MVIAMAIMAIIFAAILPQFRAIQNSWDSKQNSAETLQNGRVLIEHLNRNLSKAVKITAVSDSSQINGYIEFQDNDVNNVRYDVNSTSDYVEFGPIGSLSDLAGPVSQFQFTCYDGNDFDTAITDVNSIRFIKVQTTLTNSSATGQNKTFTTYTYLRASSIPGNASLVGWWKLDETDSFTASDSSGNGNDGTLVNMTPDEDWVTGKIGGGLDFDGLNDYVNCQNSESLNITGDISIAAWIFARSADLDIITKDSYDIAYSVWLSPACNIRFALNNDRLTTNLTLSLDTWYHIAATREGDERKIYINGQEDASDTYGTAIGTTASPLTISTSSYTFDGVLDDVRLYNCALSQEEVYQLVGGAFQQDEGSDGIVSIEAEHYITNTPQGGHQWTFVTSPGGYSDEGAMEATPDSGTNQNTAYAANSPHLDFLVNFVKTGTHYVWVRGYGKDGAADSCHAGLDGQEISTCDRLNYFSSLYAWHKETLDGSDTTFNVSTAGIHTFNIWMREDGFVIDKIVLTSSLSYTPFGAGPAESEQSEPGGGGGLLP
jgi:type II secretory pathway pseudopilin PulG